MESELAAACCTKCLKDRITKGVIVSECLPVRAFGNQSDVRVEVATVGLNPALNEFGAQIGRWKAETLRLPVLADFHKRDRASLDEDDVKKVRTRRENYFCDTQRKPHTFFTPIKALLRDVNSAWSYEKGSAVHFDLVACATTVSWSWLSARVAGKLAENCRPHFLNTLTETPLTTHLLLNGAFVFGELCRVGLYMKLERGPESVCKDPLLIGWRGTIVLRSGKRPFCAWSVPVSHLQPQQREALVSWLRRHCG